MSGPQTPTPVRPQVPAQDAKKNPLAYVLTRWVDFDTKAKAGTLGPDHAKSIRTIITQQPRAAILQGFLTLRYDIFKDMCPVLDPRIEHGGPPSLAMEDYQREHALALEDLKTLSMRRGLAANQAGAGAGAGGSGTGMGTGASTSGSQQGSSPVGTPQPQPLSQPQLRPQSQLQNRTGASPAPNSTGSPRPPASNATAPQGIGRPPIRPGPNPPLPEGLMALADVRKILGVANQEQRQAIFEKNPGLEAKFSASVKHYQALQAQNQNRQNAQGRAGTPGPNGGNPNTNARPPNTNPNTNALASAPSSGPSTPSSSQNTAPSNTQTQAQNQIQIQGQGNTVRPPGSQSTPARPPIAPNQNPGNNPHGATPTPNPNAAGGGIPNRPFNLNQPPQRQGPPAPPPVPIEAESSRRKRKLRETLREEAPGLEIEIGVDQIVSDYLDAFIDEAARGAIRLAKHRKGNKVETKDMALYLDVTHDMSLPGFNVQLPQRQHTSGDNERKKGKAVAPRAARKGKDAE